MASLNEVVISNSNLIGCELLKIPTFKKFGIKYNNIKKDKNEKYKFNR